MRALVRVPSFAHADPTLLPWPMPTRAMSPKNAIQINHSAGVTYERPHAALPPPEGDGQSGQATFAYEHPRPLSAPGVRGETSTQYFTAEERS